MPTAFALLKPELKWILGEVQAIADETHKTYILDYRGLKSLQLPKKISMRALSVDLMPLGRIGVRVKVNEFTSMGKKLDALFDQPIVMLEVAHRDKSPH